MPIWLRTLLVAMPLALLAACGGGDDEAPIEPVDSGNEETSETIDKRELIRRADATCAEANVAIANLATGTEAIDLEVQASQERQVTRGVRDAIAELGTPEQDQGALNDFTAALAEQLRILGRRETAAERGDTAAYETLGADLAQAKSDARVAAEEYGFEDCGQEGEVLEGGEGTDGASGAPSGEQAPAPAPAPAPEAAPAPEPAPEAPSGGAGLGEEDGGAGGGTGGDEGGGDSGAGDDGGGVSP